MSICNAEKTAAIFIISGMTNLRITNAHIHDCRIANSAGRGRALRKTWTENGIPVIAHKRALNVLQIISERVGFVKKNPFIFAQ
jgi:hypothetical protein